MTRNMQCVCTISTDVEESHPSLSPVTDSAHRGVAGGILDPHLRITVSTLKKASLPGSPRLLLSRICIYGLEADPRGHAGPKPVAAKDRPSYEYLILLFQKKIMSYKFPKKFMIPNLECYTRMTDPVQHLRVYQVKMVVHSHDDHLMCLVFFSSLKGMALVWFYSLSLSLSLSLSRHNLSEASKRLAMPSSTNMHRGRSLRRTTTTSSPSR